MQHRRLEGWMRIGSEAWGHDKGHGRDFSGTAEATRTVLQVACDNTAALTRHPQRWSQIRNEVRRCQRESIVLATQ